jgi:hypothetical protein
VLASFNTALILKGGITPTGAGDQPRHLLLVILIGITELGQQPSLFMERTDVKVEGDQDVNR